MAQHRHWPAVLHVISGCQLFFFPRPLPSNAELLGGTMELHGHHVTLACFHGVNFRAKSWALFQLKGPNIFFSTEAQHIPHNGGFVSGHVK